MKSETYTTVALPKEIHRKLVRAAKKQMIRKAEFVRRAILEALKGKP